MEEDILITKDELEYLRSRLLAQYDKTDKEKNDGLELNTHKKNYILLAKKLTDLIQDQRKYGATYTYKSIGTSQLIAFIYDTNQGKPKDFLVEACYQYIYGEKRKYFFQSREGKDLLESWKNTLTEGVSITETIKNKALEAESAFVQPEIVKTKTAEVVAVKPFWLRYIKAIALMSLSILGLSLYMTYKFYNKYQLEHLWAMPTIEEEMVLKNRMTFINDAAFQNIVLDCIHSIETQYEILLKGQIKTNISNELIYYQNEKNSEELSLMSYHFYTGFASWWSPYPLTQGIQDTVHSLFDNLVDSSFIKPKNSNADNPKEPFYVKKFLKVNQDEFLPVSIFTLFKNPSTELIIRYPPFKEDKNHLDQYVLKTRQWFNDAYGMEKYTTDRNSKIQWTWKNSKGQTIPVGLSKPFLSVRTGTPLHRVLWFKIPSKSNDSILFCVNMILNNK